MTLFSCAMSRWVTKGVDGIDIIPSLHSIHSLGIFLSFLLKKKTEYVRKHFIIQFMIVSCPNAGLLFRTWYIKENIRAIKFQSILYSVLVLMRSNEKLISPVSFSSSSSYYYFFVWYNEPIIVDCFRCILLYITDCELHGETRKGQSNYLRGVVPRI